MGSRRSIHQLLLILALSQVLAIQGLLLVTAGGLAAARTAGAAGIGPICSGAPTINDKNTDLPGQTEHHDCLGGCLLNRAVGGPPIAGFVLALLPRHELSDLPQEPALSKISRAAAFLARAPPMLI